MDDARPVESIEELYGTWRLVSWTRRLLDTGETVEAFGKTPRGFLNYGRDGRVFFMMTREQRAKPEDLTKLTDAQRAELYDSMVAYAGTFTFDGTVATCNVDISWNEVWTGTAQVRNVRFEGARLIWSTNPQTGIDGRRVVGVFVWEKLQQTSNLPDLGAEVRPLVQALPAGIQPRLMARLERAAADRYQTWAARCPEPAQAEGLRACALREQEVAQRVEALFPSQPDEDRHLRDALPRIAEAYRAALSNRPVNDQYAIQAAAERRGAAFWRSLASSVTDVAVREALGICADLEERSAEFLEALLAENP